MTASQDTHVEGIEDGADGEDVALEGEDEPFGDRGHGRQGREVTVC